MTITLPNPYKQAAILARTWPAYGPYPPPPNPDPVGPTPLLLLPLDGDATGTDQSGSIAATINGPVRWVDVIETDPTDQFIDTFNRADTSPGTLGNGWAMTGSGYLTGHISSNTFVGQENIYAYRDLGFTPSYMRADVVWVAGAAGATVTLISGLTGGGTLLDDIVHFFVTEDEWALQVREAGGSFVGLASGSHTIQRDGRVYTIWMQVDGNTATLGLPDGTTDQVTDARIGNLMGPWVTFQIVGDETPPTENTVRIDRAEASVRTIPGRQAALLDEPATNMMKNPAAAVSATFDFEDNVTATRTTAIAFNGPASLRITKVASGGASLYLKHAPLNNGTEYTLTAWMRTDPANIANPPRPRLGVAFEGPYSGYIDLTDEFAPYSLTFTSNGAGGIVVEMGDGAAGDSLIVGHIQCVALDYVTSPIPEINADGSLPTGYTSAGTAHDSASTRAAASITVAMPEEPAFVMARYSEDDGETWATAYQVPDVLGTYSSLSWNAGSGGYIAIETFRSLRIRDVLAFDQALTTRERERIEERMIAGTLDWEDFA